MSDGSIGVISTRQWSPSRRKPKKQQKPLNDLSRSLTPFDPNGTIIGVIELSKESWLVGGIIPGGHPVEQPTKCELLINLRTAKALGLTVPPTLPPAPTS